MQRRRGGSASYYAGRDDVEFGYVDPDREWNDRDYADGVDAQRRQQAQEEEDRQRARRLELERDRRIQAEEEELERQLEEEREREEQERAESEEGQPWEVEAWELDQQMK